VFKNNSRIILLGLCSISIAAYVIYYSGDDDTSVNLTPSSSVNPALVPFKEKLKAVFQNKHLVEAKKKAEVREVISTLPQPYRRQYQVALSDLPDLSMYGRVIDQYGQPVVNAGIWQNGGSAYLRGGGGRGYARTDEEGYFRIDTTGAFLELGGITHPEMDYLNYGPQEHITSRKLYGSSVYFSSSPNFSQGEIDIREFDTKEKAFLIHAWRLQGFDGTIKGKKILTFKPDGSIYTIKFSENENIRDKSKFITEGENDGDLWISCTRDSFEKKGEYGDWRFEIMPLGGGIQETNDLYMNVAPDSGYQSSLIVSMKKGKQGFKPGLINKRYYFKAHNGKTFGMLYVYFRPFNLEDSCRLDIIEYRYNPTSSRNLELKRNNTSQPQLPTVQKLASNF